MSGRPRSIDRDKVLDAAEAIVIAHGAAGLSFDAVAKAAGITKGGVQYCFGTKEGMIRAMLDRWGEVFEQEVMRPLGPDPTTAEVIARHIDVSLDSDSAEDSRSAVMMTALLQSAEQLEASRAWYNSRLAGLDFTRDEDRQRALAFLASEGVFFLKSFGLMSLPDEDWQRLFDSIRQQAKGQAAG